MYVAYRYQHGHCLAALPATTCAFNSLMQQNACYRNIKWTFAELLPCYYYAIKTNRGTIRSRRSQPPLRAKEGEWLNCKLITAWHYNCEPDSCNLFDSCNDSFFCQHETHTAQESGSQLWCRAVMSLQFTHVPSFACRGGYESRERVVLLLVFIAW